MLCCFTKGKVKQVVVDDVNEKVISYGRASDAHLADTRRVINQLLQLVPETHCGDDEGVNEQYVTTIKQLKQLVKDYEKKEKEFIEQKKSALGSICTLLENIHVKKKRSSSYLSIDRRLLEEYLAEETPDPPTLRAVEQSSSRENKIRHLEHEIERCQSIISNLESKLDDLKAEKKRLKTSSLSQVSETKDSIVKTTSVNSENQPFKKSNGKEAIIEVYQQDHARRNRNDSYSKMNEYAEKNVKQYNRDDTIVNVGVSPRVVLNGTEKEANSCREIECIQREIYDGLSKKEKDIEGSKLDIEKLNNERKRLENDIKELQDKYCLIEEESRMLKSIANNKTTSDKATSHDKDIDIVKHENVTLQRNIEQLQYKISELEKKLRSKQEDSDHWHECLQVEKDKNKQITQDKAAIEKERNEIRCELRAKQNEETRLKDELNQEKSIIIQLRQEKEEVQRFLNVKEVDLVKQKETSDNRFSQMQLENKQQLLEISNTQRKTQKEASISEAKLREKLVDLEQDIKKKVAHNSEMESQIQNYLQKNTNLEIELQKEKKDNLAKQEQIERIKLQLDDAIKNNQELKTNLLKAEENAESKVKKSVTEVENLLKEKNTLTENLTEMHQNMQSLQATLSSQKETFEAKLSDLKQEKKVLTENLADMTNNIQELQCRLLSQKEDMEAKVSDLKRNLNKSQKLNSETEKAYSSFQQDHLELKQMYDKVKDELDQFKSIQTIQIQLYHNSKVPLVSKVETELKSQLKQQLESSTTKVEFIDCEKVTDVDSSKPLLIVCICASRLGTDAATAIQNLKLTSKMALLVFHHKDGHALPNQASEHVLTGNEYKVLGGIFDFGFLSGKGMYSCELNDSNFRSIIQFINKEGARCVGN